MTTNQEIDEGVVEPGEESDDLAKIIDLNRLVELNVDAVIAYMRGEQNAEWFRDRVAGLVDRAYEIGAAETQTDFEKGTMIDNLLPHGTLEA